MPASIVPFSTPDELEELDTRPMTDHKHLATFGWAWDDPNGVEVEA